MARKQSSNENAASTVKKLKLHKETVRDLSVTKDVRGGRPVETQWTLCGQGSPTQCYKPNPY